MTTSQANGRVAGSPGVDDRRGVGLAHASAAPTGRVLGGDCLAALVSHIEAAKSRGWSSSDIGACLSAQGVERGAYGAAKLGQPISDQAASVFVQIGITGLPDLPAAGLDFNDAPLQSAPNDQGPPPSARLMVDAEQIAAFTDALFRHASEGQTLAFRAFKEGQNEPLTFKTVALNGSGLAPAVEAAVTVAQLAADALEPAVFCPPIAGFRSADEPWRARAKDLNEGLALSVECDERAAAAKATLEGLLGPATVVVASGGEWMDPETGELEPKLHLHWRLSEPATGADLDALKAARKAATGLVGGDPTNVPMVHPIRWPGSWHRKKVPRLAQIVSLAPEREIDLGDAAERLTEAAAALPPVKGAAQSTTGARSIAEALSPAAGKAEELAALLRGIFDGTGYHDGTTRLAAHLIGSGTHPGAAVNLTRAAMLAIEPAQRKDTWQARFEDIPRCVSTAEEKYRAGPVREVVTTAAGDLRDAETGQAVELQRVAAAPEYAEFPDELTRPPGLLGDLVDYIEATARYPQRGFALAVALCVLGTAAGRKYAGPTRSGTHLYILSLGPTGAGKNHAPKMGARILERAGLSDKIGPSQFMSMSAVFRELSERPSLLAFTDEFGGYMKRIASKHGSPHERAVRDILRTAWGASYETLRPLAYADAARRLEPIQAPALSICGMSTAAEFYEALEGNDVFNGFLNRFLVIATEVRAEEREPLADEFDVPEDLAGRVRTVASPGVIYSAMMAGEGGRGHSPAVRLDWASAEARGVYSCLKVAILAREEDAGLLSRVAEMAVRLATIRAVGCNAQLPAVTVADIEWGRDVALWSAERMIRDAARFMVETEHQGRANGVLRLIQDAPKSRISRKDLNRKLKHKFDARALDMIIRGLIEAEQIEEQSERPNGACKPTTFYAAVE